MLLIACGSADAPREASPPPTVPSAGDEQVDEGSVESAEAEVDPDRATLMRTLLVRGRNLADAGETGLLLDLWDQLYVHVQLIRMGSPRVADMDPDEVEALMAEVDALAERLPPSETTDDWPMVGATTLGRVRLEEGARDAEPLRTFLETKREEVQACYRAALDTYADEAGHVVVYVHLDAGGIVGDAESRASSISQDTLADCIVDAMRGWRFPPSQDAAVVTVEWVMESRRATRAEAGRAAPPASPDTP